MQTQPNGNYIPLARIGSARLGVGSTKLGIGFLDTSMLVSPTQNDCVGAQREQFRIAVEYRLKRN